MWQLLHLLSNPQIYFQPKDWNSWSESTTYTPASTHFVFPFGMQTGERASNGPFYIDYSSSKTYVMSVITAAHDHLASFKEHLGRACEHVEIILDPDTWGSTDLSKDYRIKLLEYQMQIKKMLIELE